MADAFIDTSFVVALVNRRDQFHSEALNLAAAFEGRPLVTTDAVLLEIGNALAKNFKAASIQIIDHFLTSKEIQIINLSEILFLRAFEFYRSRNDQTWGLVDCISFVVMLEIGVMDALTTDKHFEQAGFRVLIKAS